jgi:hypothetical protein
MDGSRPLLTCGSPKGLRLDLCRRRRVADPLIHIELSLRQVEAFVVGFGRTTAMVREGAVEVAMPMGNAAIGDLTEHTGKPRHQKSIQYP